MKRFGIQLATIAAIAGALCYSTLIAPSASAPAFAETSAPASESSALPAVKETIDSVVAVAEKYRGEQFKDERRKELRKIINPRFDFREMAKRSLGAQWSQISEEQQKKFTDVFSELLARTYLSKVETVKPGMVSVDSERSDLPRSLVKTSVKHEGDTFPIDYRLNLDNGTWRVYDVIVENIGLIANYRNEFAGIIRKDGFDALLTKLEDKVK